MKRFGHVILAVALLVFASGYSGPLQSHIYLGERIAATTLDAASSSFTIGTTHRPSGLWGLMTVRITVTDADNSVTAITMICGGSSDGNSTSYTFQECAVAAGVATCNNLSWVFNPTAVTSPKRWQWRVDIEGVEDVTCTFTDTGGVVADTIQVAVGLATKGS